MAAIPNGVEVPGARPEQPRPEGLGRLLFLSRIHPKKGLDLLVPVWRELERELGDWELVIAGPNEKSHREEIEALARDHGCRRLHFHQPVYGDQKSSLIWSADLFVLPSRNENFGMVAEALAHGVPVVASREAPWPGLIEHGWGWWVNLEPGPLLGALREGNSARL